MTMPASSSAAAEVEPEPVVHAAFNSEGTHFVAATASGIRVFSCKRTPLEHAFSKGFVPSRVITADLARYGTPAAVVLRPAPPSASAPDADAGGDRVSYCCGDALRGEALALRDDVTSPCRVVRAVRHAGGHVLVAGDGRAALHGATSGRAVKRLLEVETGPNPLGVCALAEARDGGKTAIVLACPCPAAKGQVQVHVVCRRGTRTGGARRVDVHAHSSRVVCVALSRDGRLLATASSKGTVVRIFTTADGNKINELRRGVDRADVYSMAFSSDSKWLAVSSDKGTIHVFSVNVDAPSPAPAQEDSNSNSPDSDTPNVGSALNAKQGSSWSFFSGFVPGYFRQDGSLAKFRVREGVKYVVAFSNDPHDPNTILIIGMDGSFYRCEFDPVKGGDMKQLEYRNFMKMK